MKPTPALAALLALVTLVAAGCTTPIYRKTVTTKCDGAGKPTEITIVEEITEPHNELERLTAPSGMGLKHINQ